MRRSRTTLALAASLVALALPSAAQAARERNPGPGCIPNQPAVAYRAGGEIVEPQPANPPIPCGTHTGYAGGESAIAVTDSGAVLYAPAVQALTGTGIQAQYFLGGNSGFARTTDLGATWSFIDPIVEDLQASPFEDTSVRATTGYPAWDQIDDKFYMDRETNTLFWADPDLPSETIIRSNDDGLTWDYSVLPVGFGGEWTQVTTAKPRASSTSGYPKVVYACGEFDSIERNGDLCQKSLDGGQTWTDIAKQGFFGSPLNNEPQCEGKEERPNFSPWAAPDPEGRLYEPVFCAGRTYLARSDDEAVTWPLVYQVPYDIPTSGPDGEAVAELRSDAKGNLYLAWYTGGNPNPNNSGLEPGGIDLTISRNGGKTWSHAISVLAPGVVEIRTHFGFDVGAPGHVVISYLGRSEARPGYYGYITETKDALAAKPLFWSGIVDYVSQPPLDSGGKGSSGGLGLDYVSAMFGPEGTPWASFWDACAENLPHPSECAPERMTPGTTTFGYSDYAGRLANPTG